MKAITLHQPWATLIAIGVKTIETRSWPTNHRGPIAIHAGKQWDSRHMDGRAIGEWRTWARRPEPWLAPVDEIGPEITGNEIELALGAVVATANLVDCIPMTDHVYPGEPECVVCAGAGELTHAVPFGPSEPLPEHGDFTVVRLDEPGDDIEGHHLLHDISDQLPYGDFAPGRWAWLLEDIYQLPEPLAARGRQGLWNWGMP